MRLTKDVDILIFIEHKDREYAISRNIARVLSEKFNYKVIIASLILHPVYAAVKYRPRVIVTPSLGFGRGSVNWIFNNLYPNTIQYVNMNYEQFIGKWQGGLKRPKSETSIRKQTQLVWGEHFKDYLLDNGNEKENIIITGRPHNQLLLEDYLPQRNYYRDKLVEQYSLDPRKKLYLSAFTENFALFTEKQVQNYIKHGANPDLIRSHKLNVAQTLETYIKWIKEHLSVIDDSYIIIKPHPSVPSELYDEISNNYPSEADPVRIVINDNAYEWLVVSDYLITNVSTLAIEAKLLRKPIFRIMPHGDLEKEDIWWCNNTIKVQSFNDFKTMFKSEPLLPILDTFSDQDNYFINYNKNGVDETAHAIHEKYRGRAGNPKQLRISLLFYSVVKSPKRLIGSLLRLVADRIGGKILTLNKFSRDYFPIQEYGK